MSTTTAIPTLLVALPLLLPRCADELPITVGSRDFAGHSRHAWALSIGLFFVPTLIAMIVSTSTQATTGSAPPTASPHPRSRT